MDKQKAFDLAKEAGIPFNKWGLIGCDACEQDIDDALQRFAALVAAAAKAEEREACAKVCEDIYNDPTGNDGYNAYYTRPYLECADAIRARQPL